MLNKVKVGASTLAAKCLAASQLAAKRAEQETITRLSLPQSFRALGKDVHANGRFRDEFANLYTEIDEHLKQIAALKEAATAYRTEYVRKSKNCCIQSTQCGNG